MKQEQLKEYLVEIGLENTVLFESPNFDEACIGFTDDGRAVYSYDKMVDWLVENWDMTYEEAVDHVNYDTSRSICPNGEHAPIIVNDLPDI